MNSGHQFEPIHMMLSPYPLVIQGAIIRNNCIELHSELTLASIIFELGSVGLRISAFLVRSQDNTQPNILRLLKSHKTGM